MAEKVPLREPNINTRKVSPMAGKKLSIKRTFRVPFRVARPVTVSRSYWVPAVRPPILTFRTPPGFCV
jgi:hypothetical protein